VSEGDTVSPDDKYLVALNKWSIDRFLTVGPLHPQNFQLIDLKGGKGEMELIADMPIGVGEPHYTQIIKADVAAIHLRSNPRRCSPARTPSSSARRRLSGWHTVEIWMSAQRSHFTPDIIRVKQGDNVKLHVTNIEQTKDATHGFAISQYNIQASLEPGEETNFEFTADKPGAYNFYCTEFCSALHLEMGGWLLVEPATGTTP
jgi:nitrous-oxide reductase